MKRHPLSQLFPELEGPDFRELVLDIKANGLHEDIVTLDGMVLDGWNRYRACTVAGIEPRLTPYGGGDPLAYVVSKNLARRHLTQAQRAEIAASIANSEQDVKGGHRYNGGSEIITNEAAANMMQVSADSVRVARAIRSKSPKLAKKVRDGKISLRKAAKKLGIVKPPKSKPQPPAAEPPTVASREQPLTPKQLKAECDRICAAVADKDAERFAQLVSDWLVKPLVNRNSGKLRSYSAYTR